MSSYEYCQNPAIILLLSIFLYRYNAPYPKI
nr:MAG TPA: hypothetical protein [Caudoviricetes sp.]